MKLRIVCPTMSGHDAEIWVDGVLTKDVTAISVEMGVHSFNTVTMTRLLGDLDLEIEAEPVSAE